MWIYFLLLFLICSGNIFCNEESKIDEEIRLLKKRIEAQKLRNELEKVNTHRTKNTNEKEQNQEIKRGLTSEESSIENNQPQKAEEEIDQDEGKKQQNKPVQYSRGTKKFTIRKSLSFMFSPSIKLENEDVNISLEGDSLGSWPEIDDEKYKSVFGLNFEAYFHNPNSNQFISVGGDWRFKKDCEDDCDMEIMPITSYVNIGLSPYLESLGFLLFVGGGISHLNYELDDTEEYSGYDFKNKFGFMYQLGMNLNLGNNFLGFIYRNTKSKWNFDFSFNDLSDLKFKSSGKANIQEIILRGGIFF